MTAMTPELVAATMPCPDHGGPPIPPGITGVTGRACPGGPAVVVDGRVVAHLGPGEWRRLHVAGLMAQAAA